MWVVPGARVPSLMEKVAGVTSSSSFAIMLAFPERLTSVNKNLYVIKKRLVYNLIVLCIGLDM